METRDARRWMFDEFTHHWGEMLRMQRAATARGHGLPAVEFSQPKPSTNSTTTVTNVSTPTAPKAKAKTLPTVVFSLLSALAAAAGVTGYNVATQKPQMPVDVEVEYSVDEHGNIQFGVVNEGTQTDAGKAATPKGGQRTGDRRK